MKTFTKYVLGVLGILTAALQLPSVQAILGGFLSSHPNVSALLGGLVGVSLALHNPTKGN